MILASIVFAIIWPDAVRGFQSQSEIKRVLTTIAKERFKEADAQLTSEGETALNEFIEAAAQRVTSDSQRDAAAEAMGKFVSEVIKQSRKGGGGRSDTGGGRVTRDSINAAKGLCPLYPIC